MRGLEAVCTSHFNIFNHGENSFFTPGTQLANIAKIKPDAPAIVYIPSKDKETIMTWRALEALSNRIAWYLLEQGIKSGKSVIVALPNIPTHIALAFGMRAAVMFPYPTGFPDRIYWRYANVSPLPLWSPTAGSLRIIIL